LWLIRNCGVSLNQPGPRAQGFLPSAQVLAKHGIDEFGPRGLRFGGRPINLLQHTLG
jgi:hypothetical protein